MLLDQLSPKFAEAQVVKPDDARLEARYVEYDSPKGSGKMRGYLARRQRPRQAACRPGDPREPWPEPAHRGRRASPGPRRLRGLRAGRVVPAGTRGRDKARELFQLDQAKTREDFIAAAGFLKARPECNGRIGAVGFCYGGGMVNFLATRLGSDLSAGVAFYGSAPDLVDVPRIKAPLLIHYAENDERINALWPA
jgi:carboxymethylenebutenolidase